MKLNKLPLNVIGLNRVGLNQIGSPSHRANTSARPYIDPEVLASLVAVCICDGKSNDDPDRAVIKNLVDPDNPFVISNAAFKLNSGYGKYIEDFSLFTLSNRFEYSEISNTKVTITAVLDNSTGIYHSVTEEDSALYWNTFKIKVSGSTDDVYIRYTTAKKSIRLYNGINTVVVPNELSWHSFVASAANVSCNITLEFVPEYEGAFVTDGKDDLITSTKTVKEMLGGSNEITVMSMMANLDSSQIMCNSNFSNTNGYNVRNTLEPNGVISMLGYTDKNGTTNNLNLIMGDKNSIKLVDKVNFNSDYVFHPSSYNVASFKTAWYWTFIANKVLTTDQINQVISYFNLDKHVKPDIIYDTIRQGITNENHASFNDKLVDFSGNGHNMKIYNSAWNKESGINDEGAWQTDGVSDYGKVENLPIYKDYTVVADREIVDGLIDNANGGVATRSYNYAKGAFGFDWKNQAFSFGGNTDRIIDVQRFISYQSKYVNNGIQLITGNVVDNNPLYMARLGEENRYSKLALWSFLLFPYSLSEFLLERQLKRYKLGTLYPNMVEWRPIISSNIPYDKIEFFDEQWTKRIYPGDYVEIGATIKANLYLNNYDISTITSLTSSQFESVYIDRKGQYYDVVLSGIKKSPQKIDITIDEYIRYENIVQPYPAIINLKQDGKTITWGDKLKVGSDIVFVGSANLLPELYTVSETRYNGVTLYPNTIIKVEKSMVFDNARTYLKANEPSCILSPNRLRIPNSSYKILGYIPDLTGKGNHGRLNNFAYTEESGANEDGSIRFDGTDDYITIPTLSHGGKQVLMKVNLQSYDRYLYDQRNSWSQYLAIVSAGKTIAYEYSNKGGKTYIDGILNEHIIDKDLLNITHNITATNANIGVQYAPNIGTSFARGNFAQMALFDFMLFPEISPEEEIKELNDIVGIEGNVWGTLTQLINLTLISNETLIKNE